MTTSSSSLRVAVVGGGIVGLATAYALTRRKAQVSVFDPTPGSGSSAGESRIFRHQHADPRLVEFAKRSHGLWMEWGERLGRPFLTEAGSILAADESTIRARAAGLRAARVEHAVLDRVEQAAAFPQFGPAGELALLDRRGGIIHAADAVRALRESIGDRLVEEEVVGCRENAGHALLITGSSVEAFDRVAIAAGADTPRIAAPIGLRFETEVRWHARFGFPTGTAAPMACLQDRSGAFGERVYGTFEPAARTFAIGLAGEGDNLTVDAAGLIDEPARLKSISSRLSEYVRKALPSLNPQPSAHRICRSIALPGGPDEFTVARAGPFVGVAGGNLFKMAPALGEAIADAVLGDEVPDPLRRDLDGGR